MTPPSSGLSLSLSLDIVNLVTLLAKGIVRYASRANSVSVALVSLKTSRVYDIQDAWAIEPLYYLVTRYPPNGSYLTTIHPLFVLVSPPPLLFPPLPTPYPYPRNHHPSPASPHATSPSPSPFSKHPSPTSTRPSRTSPTSTTSNTTTSAA